MEEINVPEHIHPHTLLQRKSTQKKYTCGGCNQPGSDISYRCISGNCHFDLHVECAMGFVEPAAEHPLSCDLQLAFGFDAVGGSCAACRRPIARFRYDVVPLVARDFSFNPIRLVRRTYYTIFGATVIEKLHPWCANLKPQLNHGVLQLKLSRNVISRCNICKNEADFAGEVGGWAYVSDGGSDSLHVACLRKAAEESWEGRVKKKKKKKRQRIVSLIMGSVDITRMVVELVFDVLFCFNRTQAIALFSYELEVEDNNGQAN